MLTKGFVGVLYDSVRQKSYAHGASTIPFIYETIGERLRKNVEGCPGEEFVVFRQQNTRKTYEEVYEDARNLAKGLLHLGLEKGDRVGIWGPNYYEWMTTQMATAMAGLIQVNVNPAYQTEELQYALDKVGVRALITPKSYKRSNYMRTLEEIFPHIVSDGKAGVGTVLHPEDKHSKLEHLIVFGEEEPVRGAWSYNDIISSGGSSDVRKLEEIEKKLGPDDPINIQFTSGTTGHPKAATLSHHNILNNAYFTGTRAHFDREKHSICIPNPLYHCFGCVLGVTAALVHRQKCVFPSPTFLAKETLEAVHHEKCSFLFGTPTMYIDILDHPDRENYDMSSLKGGYISGAPCPRPLCERLVNELNLHDLCVLYGSTELSPVVTMSLLNQEPYERIKSVGYPLDHTELCIVSEDGQLVPKGEKGQLLCRGYMVMLGYWNDEERTKRDITPTRWYKTGDTSVMFDDGSVNIVGRTKDLIIRGGENIYPTEIEQFLFKLPYVADAQIIGVPDNRFGEAVCAWIRLREEVEENITQERVQTDCQGKIAHFKIPKYVLIKSEHEFPMTATGKVKKYEMKEISKRELGLNQVRSHFNE